MEGLGRGASVGYNFNSELHSPSQIRGGLMRYMFCELLALDKEIGFISPRTSKCSYSKRVNYVKEIQMSPSLPKAVAVKASQQARTALIANLCATRGTKYQSLKSYRSL